MLRPFALLLLLALPAYAQTPAPAQREIRAQLVAVETAVISAEIAGKIEALPFRDGDRFQAGQVLLGIDCAIHRARLAKTEAALDKTTRKLRANQRLGEMKSIGTLEVEMASADQAEAAAETRLMRAMIEHCTIKAPFDGRVVALIARKHQFIGEGQPVLEIVSTGALEIELLVPSRSLALVRPGYRFEVAIDETGKTYAAEVTRVSARVDPVSQSIRVYATTKDDAPELLAGMSGRARLPGT